MKYTIISLLVLFVLGLMIPNAFGEYVPDWVKNTAGWWAQAQFLKQNLLTQLHI